MDISPGYLQDILTDPRSMVTILYLIVDGSSDPSHILVFGQTEGEIVEDTSQLVIVPLIVLRLITLRLMRMECFYHQEITSPQQDTDQTNSIKSFFHSILESPISADQCPFVPQSLHHILWEAGLDNTQTVRLTLAGYKVGIC